MTTSLINSKRSASLKRSRFISKAVRYFLALVMIVFALFPVVWMLSASLNPTGNLATQQLIPPNANLNNYRALFNSPNFPFATWMMNSLMIASGVTVVSVLITTTTAYAFSRFRFYGRGTLLKSILLIQVFPAILAMVAIFSMVQQFGTYISALGLNSLVGLGFIYLGGAMGINIWLMKGFFDTVPIDIDESAMVDGASHWQAFWQLLFPLVRPIVVVVGLLTFIGVYGEFLLARVLLKSTDSLTVMVGLYIVQANQFTQNWGLFTAGALIAAVPVVVLYLLLQDYIVGGLTSGAVKG